VSYMWKCLVAMYSGAELKDMFHGNRAFLIPVETQKSWQAQFYKYQESIRRLSNNTLLMNFNFSNQAEQENPRKSSIKVVNKQELPVTQNMLLSYTQKRNIWSITYKTAKCPRWKRVKFHTKGRTILAEHPLQNVVWS
jgi:hypothetical protein